MSEIDYDEGAAGEVFRDACALLATDREAAFQKFGIAAEVLPDEADCWLGSHASAPDDDLREAFLVEMYERIDTMGRLREQTGATLQSVDRMTTFVNIAISEPDQVRLAYAWSQACQQMEDEAEEALDQITGREAQVALVRARICLLAGRYEDALTFAAVPELQTEPLLVNEAQLVRGVALARLGRLDQAIPALQLVEGDGSLPDPAARAFLVHALIARAQGNEADAQALLDAAKTVAPRHTLTESARPATYTLADLPPDA